MILVRVRDADLGWRFLPLFQGFLCLSTELPCFLFRLCFATSTVATVSAGFTRAEFVFFAHGHLLEVEMLA
jgi:hypothetical protein